MRSHVKARFPICTMENFNRNCACWKRNISEAYSSSQLLPNNSYYFWFGLDSIFFFFFLIPKRHQVKNPPIHLSFCASLASHVIIIWKLTAVHKSMQILQLYHVKIRSQFTIHEESRKQRLAHLAPHLITFPHTLKQSGGQPGQSLRSASPSARNEAHQHTKCPALLPGATP